MQVTRIYVSKVVVGRLWRRLTKVSHLIKVLLIKTHFNQFEFWSKKLMSLAGRSFIHPVGLNVGLLHQIIGDTHSLTHTINMFNPLGQYMTGCLKGLMF